MNVEVVMLGGSEEAIRHTHSRYFFNAAKP